MSNFSVRKALKYLFHPERKMIALPILTKMNSDKVSTMIGELGAIQEIISTIRRFEKEPKVVQLAIKALWTLCVNETNAAIATAEKALKVIWWFHIRCLTLTHRGIATKFPRGIIPFQDGTIFALTAPKRFIRFIKF